MTNQTPSLEKLNKNIEDVGRRMKNYKAAFDLNEETRKICLYIFIGGVTTFALHLLSILFSQAKFVWWLGLPAVVFMIISLVSSIKYWENLGKYREEYANSENLKNALALIPQETPVETPASGGATTSMLGRA